VLSDFEVYLPLLDSKAFVTFHDTRMSSVQDALAHLLERYRDFQILDLPDIGAGLAIVRRSPARHGGTGLAMPATRCRDCVAASRG
jgi:hypothetical protein